MAIIQKEIELVGSKGRSQELALFDSGASYSFIDKMVAVNLGTFEPLSIPLEFEMAKKGEKVSATEAIRLDFYLNSYRFSDEFIILPNLAEPVIIGVLTLQKWRLKLDFEHDDVIIDPKVNRRLLLI
jgi:hypothetical protein